MVEQKPCRSTGRIGFGLSLVGWVFVGSTVLPASAWAAPVRSQEGSTANLTRVRSTDAGMLELLREGSERSATFRSLVDEISRSNGIVYLEFGYCAFGHLDGCVLPFLVSSHGDRYLRLVVTPEKKVTHDQRLGLIAHEMRHALEVLEHPEVVDTETLLELYRKIGTPGLHATNGYETSSAHAAGDAVRAELSATHLDSELRAHRTNPQPRPDHILLTGREGLTVRFAVDAARRRLAKPECQKLFTDFTDSSRHVLAESLAAWRMSPGEALGALYFVEGGETNQCRENALTDAFTAPGNRVIYVCGKRFANESETKTTREITLIHELLHTLGLGENPPASADITRMVIHRCGN